MALSSSPSTTQNMITLKSSDKKEFIVEEKVVIQSRTIQNIIEEGCATATIPIPNIDGETLELVLLYFKKHANDEEHKRAKEQAIADEDPDRKFVAAVAYPV